MSILDLNPPNKTKVFMLPFAVDNPYQTKLKNALLPHSVEVKGVNKLFFIKSLLQYRPDIVHFHWLQVYCIGTTPFKGFLRVILFFLQFLIIKALRYPVVWTVHNLVNHENKALMLDKFVTWLVGRFSTAIITHSRQASLMLTNYLPSISEKKIVVVEHGNFIDEYPTNLTKQESREKLGISPNDFVVLFLGQIREYKGVGDLIDAFSSLPKVADFTLLIAGKPSNEALKNTLISAIPNGVNIKFVAQFIPDDQVASFFTASDVSVLPYKSILTSGALVLAMGFGKPVIIPKIGPLQETAHHDATITYTTNDIDSLAKALRRAYESRMELVESGRLNAQKALACSWEEVGGKTNAVYCSV